MFFFLMGAYSKAQKGSWQDKARDKRETRLARMRRVYDS